MALADPKSVQAGARPLFYFHGFNSGIPANLADSPKILTVEEYARRSGRDFRPLSIDYRRAQSHSQDILEQVGPDAVEVLFCGASMGGWLARIMQLMLLQHRPHLEVEAVAFNPAFDLAQFGFMLEGEQVNSVTLEAYHWTAQHSNALVAMEQSVEYLTRDVAFNVYVDSDDEVINAGWSERFHQGFSRFTRFPGGDHSFQHAREALNHYDNGCWQRPLQ